MAEKTKKGFLALAEACTILAKYSDDSYVLEAEHDTIYASVNPEVISQEDKQRLEELGWHENDEYDPCMAMFT